MPHEHHGIVFIAARLPGKLWLVGQPRAPNSGRLYRKDRMKRSKMRCGHDGKVRPEYWVWRDMKQRCRNPRNSQYRNYGGRGIVVWSEWLVFDNFFRDMGSRPSPKHTIERKNNELGYYPNNCCWIPRFAQQDNTRQSQRITYKGETHSAAEWCRRLGLNYRMVQQRFGKLKWPAEKALLLPKQPRILNLKKGGAPCV